MRKKLVALSVFAAGAFLSQEAAGQAPQKTPLPKAAPRGGVPIVVEPPWYQDPRWWGIGATGALSITGLILQWCYRRADKRNDTASDHFDGDIRDPIKAIYKDLRGLGTAAALASDLIDADARSAAMKKLRFESACETLSLFSMVLNEADVRLNLKGDFSQVNADLEDELYIAMGALAKCEDPVERRALAKKIKLAVTAAIVQADGLLGAQRPIYISKWK